MKLSKIKSSPQHLLMGPWTHGQYEVTFAGDIDFGLESHVNYLDTKLAWFDHYLKGMKTEVVDWEPVRFFTMGTGGGGRTILGSLPSSCHTISRVMVRYRAIFLTPAHRSANTRLIPRTLCRRWGAASQPPKR